MNFYQYLLFVRFLYLVLVLPQHTKIEPLQEMDEIIYAVCTLCRDHEKAGFMEGIQVGLHLMNALWDQCIWKVILLTVKSYWNVIDLLCEMYWNVKFGILPDFDELC